MKIVDRIALVLTIVGALNWGSVGLFGFDCVAFLCGGQMAVQGRTLRCGVASGRHRTN